jgi:peptide-methionine (S)-S-oxide reductase
VGTQYRSVIFVHDDAQRAAAERSRQAVQARWDQPVVTEIEPLPEFWPAEEYHQDYFARNPDQGYCQVVINPKLRKLREKHAARLRA